MNYVIDYDSTFIQVESLDELSKNSKSYNPKIKKKLRKLQIWGWMVKFHFLNH